MGVKKNIIYNITYQILILFLPLVTTPYISRVIGVEGIGSYSYIYSIVSYFVLFAMLGVTNYGTRSIAVVKDDKLKLSETFFNIYALQLITSILMVILYLGYIYFFITENLEIAYIQLIFIISMVLDINWFFFGLEQFKLTVIRNTIIKILTALSIFIFVKDSNDLWVYTLIMSLGTLISQLIIWPFVKKYIIWIQPTIEGILSHLKPNLILFIPILSMSIYKILDKTMLGILTNTIQVGYYENSEKIVNIPISITSAVGLVMIPRMTNLITTGDSASFHKYIENSLKFIMFIAFGSTLGIIAISSSFIPLYLGEEFSECIKVVSLLSLTVLFISWGNVIRTQYLIPRERNDIYITSTLLGTVVNIIINLLLIPSFGASGAAIGTIFAEAIVAFYQTFKVRKDLDITKFFKNSSIYIIPSIFMYLSIIFVKNVTGNTFINLLVQIILGGGVYIISSVILLFIADKDMRIKFNQVICKMR